MYNDLKNAANGFGLSAVEGSGRRLIIITGGRLVAAAGFLIAQLTDAGSTEGDSALLSAVGSACTTFHGSLNPYQSNSLPSLGGGSDQEKCLIYLAWIQSLIEATGGNTGLGGTDTDDVCSAIATCAGSIDSATYALLD